jgi:hypothetical protein
MNKNMTREEIHRLPIKAQLYINNLQRKLERMDKLQLTISEELYLWVYNDENQAGELIIDASDIPKIIENLVEKLELKQ